MFRSFQRGGRWPTGGTRVGSACDGAGVASAGAAPRSGRSGAPGRIDRRGLLHAAALCLTAGRPAWGAARVQSDATLLTRVVLTKLTWAGVCVEYKGVAVYVDATAPRPDDQVIRFDPQSRRPSRYALVSHGHGDHFDLDYLRLVLGDRGVIFCHHATAGDIDRRILRVQAVDLWEPVFLPRSGADVVAFAVPAVDGFGVAQASWVLRCGDVRLIHCGDTLWHGEWWDIGRALGPFDVACLPINGARQTVGRFQDVGVAGVMGPEQAVAAARALGATTIVPIHYGRSTLDGSYAEVVDAEAALLNEAKRQGVRVRVLKAGETWAL